MSTQSKTSKPLKREHAYPILERAVLTADPSHPEHARHAQALQDARLMIFFVRFNETHQPRPGRPRGDGHMDGDALIYMAEQVMSGQRPRTAAREALRRGLTTPGHSEEAGIKRLERKFRARREEFIQMAHQMARFC
jgi:hypothetical protein